MSATIEEIRRKYDLPDDWPEKQDITKSDWRRLSREERIAARRAITESLIDPPPGGSMSDEREIPSVKAVEEWMELCADHEKFLRLDRHTHAIATALYAQEVSKPVPVNADSLPDYQQIAKDCVERAKETAPYLLRELGLIPQEEA